MINYSSASKCQWRTPQTQTRSQTRRRRRSERQSCTYRKQGGLRGQHCGGETPIVSLNDYTHTTESTDTETERKGHGLSARRRGQ